MGLLSSIFGGDSGGDSGGGMVSAEPQWQQDLRKRLAKFAEPKAQERISRAGEPYPGELVAPLGEYEQMGLGKLGEYLKAPGIAETPLFRAGAGELERTLGGEFYDPFQGEYYRAYKANLMRELEEAKDRLAAKTSARDKYFGGGRIAATGELEETATGQLQQTLGQLYESERTRRLGAVPLGLQVAGLPTAELAERAQTGITLGGLPRSIEQAQLGADYNEYLRQLSDLGIPLDVAIQMATYQPPQIYQPPTDMWGGLAGFAEAMGGGGGFSKLLGGLGGGSAPVGPVLGGQ